MLLPSSCRVTPAPNSGIWSAKHWLIHCPLGTSLKDVPWQYWGLLPAEQTEITALLKAVDTFVPQQGPQTECPKHFTSSIWREATLLSVIRCTVTVNSSIRCFIAWVILFFFDSHLFSILCRNRPPQALIFRIKIIKEHFYQKTLEKQPQILQSNPCSPLGYTKRD